MRISVSIVLTRVMNERYIGFSTMSSIVGVLPNQRLHRTCPASAGHAAELYTLYGEGNFS